METNTTGVSQEEDGAWRWGDEMRFWRVFGIGLCGIMIGLLFIGSGTLTAQETARWPQFRGPTGQGIAPDATPLLEWSETKNVRWKTEIAGLGHSSPVIWDDQLWVATATTDGKEISLVCLNRHDGKVVHNVVVLTPEEIDPVHGKNTYASPTPVIAEGRIYAHFGRYGAVAVDTASGEILWKNEELSFKQSGGPGSSPILYKDLLIITCDGSDQQYTAGLDCATGKIRWKRERSAPYRDQTVTRRAFVTPLVIEHEGRVQMISPAADQCHSLNPETGEELWHIRYVGYSTVPRPVFGNGIVYICTGYFTPELTAIQVDGSGDVTDSKILWKGKKGIPENPSPLLFEGDVYIVSDDGVASRYDAATGKQTWAKRLGGNFSASPLLAGGHIYCCSEQGETHIIKPGIKPEVVGVNKLPGSHMASPAAVGKDLYLRTEKGIWCLGE